MGIAATLAVPSFREVLVESKIDSAAAFLIGDVRFAQSLAIRTQQTHGVAFDSANDEYRVIDQNGATVQHPLTKQLYRVVFGARTPLQGVDMVSALFGASNTVSFDAFGSPQSSGTVTLSYAAKQRSIDVVYPTGRMVIR
jgi:Tfp pilus assembly protein FimT